MCEHKIHISNRSRHTQREICALFPQYVVMLFLADRHPLNDLNTSTSLSIETNSLQLNYTKNACMTFSLLVDRCFCIWLLLACVRVATVHVPG